MKTFSIVRDRNSGPRGGIVLDFMMPQAEQSYVTESSVSVPPALIITDVSGAVWTLGFNQGSGPRGEFSFDVLRNGENTGECASRVEVLRSRVRCFTSTGWKYWNGRSFV